MAADMASTGRRTSMMRVKATQNVDKCMAIELMVT
jgi:hypothetical protein